MSHCLKRLKTFTAIFLSINAILLLLLAANQSALGQAGGASISGQISDKSGAIIRNAEIDITNKDTSVKLVTMSNTAGIYSFPSLLPGNYIISVHKQGFRSVDLPGLTVYTQDNLERNFVLEVGSVSESVTVNSGVSNDSPAVSMTVSREFVEDTPLNGRSFQDLIQLAPGVAMAATATSSDGYYSINGQRTDSNQFTVDGVSATLGGVVNRVPGDPYGQGISGSDPMQTALGTTQSLTSVDSLQEFKIQTSGYAAEFGRNPGGQIQLTTRSGTNELHGTLFDYLRNTAFDANSYSNGFYDIPKTAEHQNDFGGTLGGPLMIPRLYDDDDRTFYFLSYEGLRLLLPAYEEEYNPTQGFRDWASPNVQPFLNTAPLPNEGTNNDGCTVTDPTTGNADACDGLFYASYSYPNNLDNYSGRLDEAFGKRYHGFLRYADTPSYISGGGESVSNSVVNVHSWTAGLTTTISNALLDEFRFNYSHDGEQSATTQRAFYGSVPLTKSLVVPPAYDGPYASAYGSIIIPNSYIYLTSFGFGNTGSSQHQYQIIDSLSWTRGSHNLKFGMDWRRLTPSFLLSTYQSSTAISTLADVEEGYATSLQVSATAPGEPVFENLSLYTQDHWRISSRVSLDYGLRWDFNPPPGPANGHYPVALTSSDLSSAALAPLGTRPYRTVYHDFGPRIGFSWNAVPTQSHALTVRGGYGVFFDTAQQVIAAAYTNGYPFSASNSVQSHVPLPLSDSALAPPATSVNLTPPYPSLYLSSPYLTSPYTEQWNLSVDEAISSKNTVTASYVGNTGKKLLFTQFYLGVPGNSDFTYVMLTNNAASSNYNGFQIQDVGHLLNGLDIVSSFTFAHALDNASNNYSLYGAVYGNSDNDLRRVLNFALNYKSPRLGHNRWSERLTNGWIIANRFAAQSGSPLSITQTYAGLPNGSYITYSPNLVPGVPIYLHGTTADLNGVSVPGGWRLNRAAFACSTTGATSGGCTGTPTSQGTLGRNFVRTPSFWTLNTAVQRSFPIYDQLHLNFRLDAFNVFNHPNLSNIDTGLSDSTFGTSNGYAVSIGSPNQLYGMGEARSLQFSLKLQF